MSCCIGNPSQAPGTNPSTSTSPNPTNPSLLSGITGIALKAFGGVAAQAELSAQQTIAKRTNTTSLSGAAATTGIILLVAVVAALWLVFGARPR